jgi:thiamine-monophosphate kinase
MRLNDIGEFGLIKKISRGCLIRPHNVVKAIGDDAAAFTMSADEVSLVTTDLLVERVHFLRNTTSGFNLGYKSLAVNLSDIAAMGGTAWESFISVAIPEDCPIDYIEDFYRGMKTLATEFDVNILGGDTTRSKDDLIINIAVIGSVPEKEILFRNAAQHGDILCATGFLGESRAGLHLLLNDIAADSKDFEALLTAHMLPKPYLREGRFLAGCNGVHAAIDVSDGISSDLGHIVEDSNVGARLYAEKIPVSKNFQTFCSQFDIDPVKFVLAGGEDYILLCTISPQKVNPIVQEYLKQFNQPLFQIGEITDSGYMELMGSDGKTQKIAPSGWNHFLTEQNTD